MQYLDHEKKFHWESRSQYIMALLCQSIGITTFIALPLTAVTHGAAGYLIGYVLTYLFIGIPLLYMEFIISQFTARDCLEVWRIRPFLSHIGYVHVFWQIMIILYNHTMVTFIMHYFLISFENPIPYYTCGKWTTNNCNILKYNYTVNQHCIKFQDEAFSYCSDLYETFPEYQYWRYYILGKKKEYYYVAWQVCFGSSFACCLLFLSSFKRQRSLKWFLCFFTVYPVMGYIILMVGSMMQKGVLTSYEETMDADFTMFVKNYRISNIILQVLYSLNIGTGVTFNMGASTSFRAPCYSNIVITVAVCAVFSVFAVCTIAMMPGPFVNVYGIKPSIFASYVMFLTFEKTPILLKEYEYSHFWLLLSFSCNAILALSKNIIVFQQMLEMLAERCALVNKYPGLACFTCIMVIFLLTTPLLGKHGLSTCFYVKKFVCLISIFMTLIECLVFVVWYGLEKFSEDVHFMQGIRPKSYMKVAWLMSSALVTYVFISELIFLYLSTSEDFGNKLGWFTLLALIVLVTFITLLKLLVAALRKRFREEIKLDPLWGPKNEVLRRSRAMFSAQAMTKEYIYRQYHLQAGILARQCTSNVRRSCNE